MGYLLVIIGAALLSFWGVSVKKPQEARPKLINDKGGLILASGLALVIIGFLI
ncbi:hypothetical protein [Leucothrix mucor]|uniref:hypothetical protein n=1 Tax=Leucothrix mucor TaxID=45248 RepID=UPI0003B3E637|nr:hypothetical protein [Leucothrix mucor]